MTRRRWQGTLIYAGAVVAIGAAALARLGTSATDGTTVGAAASVDTAAPTPTADPTDPGAAPDTRLNAQRKAYTAARSDARSTRELAEKVQDDPVERASFDPFFTFFLGGVAVFDGETRLGAVGVSGLPGDVDEQLALRAIEATA